MSFTDLILILSAASALITLLISALALLLHGPFDLISDALSIPQMLLMGIAAIYIYRFCQNGSFALALSALLLSLGGTLTIAVLQTLLVARVVGFEDTFVGVLAAGVPIGLGLILASVAVAMSVVVPPGILYLGIAVAVGYIVPVIGNRIGEQSHALFYGGSLLGLVGYVVWAVWLTQFI